jgi:hypothetical protein
LPASLVFAAAVSFSGATALAQNSGFNLDLHADSHATAADIGLPAYPGATLAKTADSDGSADLGMVLGDFHFRLKVASYVSADSPERVLAFYRKPLARYGEVLECSQGKPVGALTVTHSGLTCSDQQGGNVHANGSVNSSTDHELRAGSPHLFRIVGIDKSESGSTRFGMVYLELPKDSDKKPQ